MRAHVQGYILKFSEMGHTIGEEENTDDTYSAGHDCFNELGWCNKSPRYSVQHLSELLNTTQHFLGNRTQQEILNLSL